MTGGRKICVCVDDSLHSEKAWLWAIGNFLRPEDTCTLLTVAHPNMEDLALAANSFGPADPMFPYNVTDEESTKMMWDHVHDHSEKLLSNFQDIAREANLATPVDTHVVNGSQVGEAMAEHVNKNHFHVCILGSRGMGTVKRQLMGLVGLGSISDYMVHHLHCPVVVVKPDH